VGNSAGPQRNGLRLFQRSARHGQPFTLTLSGAAGDRFTSGIGGPELELDAVEFCRILSGRAPGSGLLSTRVPF